MSTPMRGADILARIKPQVREESTEIVLSGDLMAKWEKLDADLAASRDRDMAGNRLADGISAKTKKLAQQVADLEKQIAEQAVVVRFRAMHKDRWRALCDNHPPRRGDEFDMLSGYNRDAVLDQAVRACMIEPVFEDCDRDEPCEHTDCGSWQQFARVVPPGEWEELKITVNSVNRGVVDAPKSALASRILDRHATTSR
jgi:hypothetical protein